MSHIFISYSRTDEAFARQLAEALSNAGSEVWLDVEDIPAGMNWSSAIQQGLDTCNLIIVIISSASMMSRNVAEEWQYFRDKGKPIVPVLWRRANVHYQLSRLQYIDFERQSFEAAFKQLHGELRRKGLRLNALQGVSGTNTEIPVQAQLPEKTSRRVPALVWGLVLVAVIGLFGPFALNDGLGGGETPTSPLTATEQAVGQAATGSPTTTETLTPMATNTPAPSTETNTPAPSATPTATLSQTDEAATVNALIQQILIEEASTVTRAAEQTSAAATARAQERAATPTAAAQATIVAQATHDWLATLDALGTATALTATATFWTPTPTPNYRLTAEALLAIQRTATQASLDATATATQWTSKPGYGGDAPITANVQWTPVEGMFDGVTMVLVPVGCFEMGGDDGFDDEQPVHR